MEDLRMTFEATLGVFKVPFTLWGYTFTFWEVFLWTAVAGLLLWFVGRLFDDD